MADPVSQSELSDILPIVSAPWVLQEQMEYSGLGTGEVLAAKLAPSRWKADVVLTQMGHLEARAIQAKLEALDGPIGNFYLASPTNSYPAAYPNASWPGNVVGTVTAKGNTLTKTFERKGASVNPDGAMFVTRSGIATVFDIDGVLKTVAANNPRFMYDPAIINLLLQSENLSARGANLWNPLGIDAVLQNAKFRSHNVFKLVEDNQLSSHYFRGTSKALTANDTRVTVTIAAKAGERNFLRLSSIVNNAGSEANNFVHFDLLTGSVSNSPGSTLLAYSCTSAGEGWWICSATYSNAGAIGTARIYVGMGTTATNATYQGDGVSGLYISEPSFNLTSGPVEYVPTTTAPAAKSLGLIIEPTRTNVVTNSVLPGSGSNWTVSNATRTVLSSGGPDGGQCVQLTENTSEGEHRILFGVSAYTANPQIDFWHTVLLKLAPGSIKKWVYAWCGSFANHSQRTNAYVNLETGELGTVSGAGGPEARIKRLADGWIAVSLKGRTGGTGTGNVQIVVNTVDSNGGSTSNIGDGVSGYLTAYWQTEEGLEPTSLIPNHTSSPATRGVESVLFYNDGGNDWTLDAVPAIARRKLVGSLNIAGYTGHIGGYEAKLTVPVKALPGVTVDLKGVNNKSLSLKGLPAGFKITGGDMFAIDYGANPIRRYLGRVVSGAVASGNGVTDLIEVRPHLPTGLTAGLAVNFVKPAAKVFILPESLQVQANAKTTNISFSVAQRP